MYQQPPPGGPQPYQPGYPTQQPPPPPPKKLNLWRWYRSRGCFLQGVLGCATLFVLLFVGFFCSAAVVGITQGITSSQSTPAAVATNMPEASVVSSPRAPTPTKPVVSPTHEPTATKPVVKPTQPPPAPGTLTATHGHPQIGGPFSDFLGAYGNYNQFSMPDRGVFYFSLYGNNKDDLFVVVPTDTHGRVFGIDLNSQAPTGWSTLNEAMAACNRFLPADAVYKRTVEITDAQGTHTTTERVYFSPSLGPLFPANTFTDENGNATTPGIFGVAYHYDIVDTNNATHMLDCSPEIGLEGK